MSLAEILHGLHWEADCHSDTTGMGPMFLDGIGARPPWAVLYGIYGLMGSLFAPGEWEWEIGLAQDFAGAVPTSMPRAPIMSNAGLGILMNFSSGSKTVRFADAVPPALKRYMKRLEREAEARSWETAGNRAAAWERLEAAARERQT